MTAHLTVATFNVRYGRAHDGRNSWRFRRGLTRRTIAGLRADVIGLQEVLPAQRHYLARGLPDYEFVGVGRDADGRGEQAPLLVTPPVWVESVRYHWFGPTPDVVGSRFPDARHPRVATIATCVHRTSGHRFVVANVHLDERLEANRQAGIDQLLAALDDRVPTLLLGDFNVDPRPTGLFSSLAEQRFRRLDYDGSSFHGWRGGRTEAHGRIDHLLVRDGADLGWAATRAELVWWASGRLPSDHWPVVARVALAPT